MKRNGIYYCINSNFFIFGIGFVGQKVIGFNTKPLSSMAIYLMTPFLAFRIFYEIEFNFDYVIMTLYTAALAYSLIGIIYIISRIRRYSNKKNMWNDFWRLPF